MDEIIKEAKDKRIEIKDIEREIELETKK